jgi:hypothetical protein
MKNLACNTALLALALTFGFCGDSTAADQSPWIHLPEFSEVALTTTVEPNVRIHVNSPADSPKTAKRPTRLIIYALPNGNTIEQTLGCRMQTGLDWHYDIQHVAAQVRLLRELLPEEQVVLICAEAPGLSWPTFRRNVPDANKKIRAMTDAWRAEFAPDEASVLLTGHSGGGAFIFGVIEGGDEIPSYVDRIAFLDANYAYDSALHDAKLLRWLTGADNRRLISVAYDDREITLNGKKVVGPDGGTFRATGRMRDGLGKLFELQDSQGDPFAETVGLDGRIHFYVHPNPQNRILHTALVGEMNGLVHVATLGAEQDETWGKFGGPRAYTKYVQPAPMTATPPEQTAATTKLSTNPANTKLPSRPTNALTGSEFITRIENASLDDREAAVLEELKQGNFPEFLRQFVSVPIQGTIKLNGADRPIETTIQVMPDYLAIGSDDDFVRMPMTPQTAQRVADLLGCVLPTRKMVDAIDQQATARITPHPMTVDREAPRTFAEHHRIIEKQRAEQVADQLSGALITGIKKDIVLTPRIFEKPQRLAIYGWHQRNDQPIQPLTIVHWNRYVDYSHGARLIRNAVEIDGKEYRIDKLLADPQRCDLVSDEGSMDPPRYPLEN